MCDVIDNLTAILQTHVVTINDALEKIHKYQEDGVTTQPFIEINQEFTSPSILEEISQAKTTINTFAVSTDAEKKEKNKGMNLTTQDRPIDNIRNITFQGIA